MSPTLKRLMALGTTLAVVLTTAAAPVVAQEPQAPKPVDIQILGLNDFHGQLEVVPATASSGGRIGFLTDQDPRPGPEFVDNQCVAPTCFPAGGVEYLATHIRNLRAENPKNTAFVSAGDLIGATPLLSALFHDEPTIEAFNLMDLDYNGVGNHEFDEGVDELLRMQYGDRGARNYEAARTDGCHPEDGCGDGDPFHGAEFDFLAANVVYKDSGDTIFAPYAIHSFQGAKVAFVGMTLEGTPEIVTPEGIASVNFLDEAATVNALVPHLKQRGVEAIVVLLHEGGSTTVSGNGAGGDPALIDSCVNPGGSIPPIVNAMDDEIDIVITGHTNWAVNCLIDGKVVTGAASQGRLITDIDAQLDKRTGDFVPGSITVDNKIVTQGVARASDLTALIAEYNVFAGPIAARVIGETTAAMDRNALTAARESTLGRLIADAQLASSQEQGAGGQIAFMNPGGIRANLDAGDITYGEAFGVQPFSNIVVTKTLTGAQIEALLEQQFRTGSSGVTATVLQVSEGFTYEWNPAGAVGSRIDPTTIKLDGTTIDPAGTYRVVMNSFLASGGDGFGVFNAGTNPTFGEDDLIALEDYLAANDPYTPVTTPRITLTP